MLEVFHAVIASLLLSAAVGCGGDQTSATDEDPAGSETGIDVGKMPCQLAILRSIKMQPKVGRDNDDLPVAFDACDSYREPGTTAGRVIAWVQVPMDTAAFATSGRSP